VLRFKTKNLKVSKEMVEKYEKSASHQEEIYVKNKITYKMWVKSKNLTNSCSFTFMV
jgi:hypothetical protein